MKKVFVSYSRRNLSVVERLARDLQDAGLDVWVDFRKIKGGEAWRQAIYNGITESEFTIICLSPPAVESEWVRRELQIAHQHKKLIIPLMIERAFDEMQQYDETKVLLDVQIINFADLSYERAFPTLLSSLPGVYTPGEDYDDIDPSEIPNPFKGLEAFQEFDSEIFFGREALIERALTRLADSLATPDATRFLGVVGASGSGKSSLVRAGIIPAIRKGKLPDSEDFPIAIVKPGAAPIEALAQRLLPLLPDTDQWETLYEQLTSGAGALSALAGTLLANSADSTRLVLVIDQFEEVFTRSPYRSQVAFIELLHHAVTEPGGRILVMITMRADFFDRVSHFANLARLIEDDKLLIVSEMSPEELRRSIEGPAIAVGLVYDHGLPDRILEEVLQQPGSLPLLQYALTELYDRRERRRLTWDAYNEIGGVRQALAQHAEEVYTGLNSAQQDIMQRLLLRLVEVSETGEATRRRVRRSELVFERVSNNALNDILDLMTSAEVRLLVASREVRADSDEDEEPTIWIEVVHEALIREWERFQGWVKEDEENLRLSTEILKSAQDWVNAGRDDAYLLTRTRLDRALVWVQTADANPLQRDFINASADARRKREAEEREQQQYVSQLEERSARRLRILAAGLAVGFVIVSIFAVVALLAQREASRQAAETRSRALAQDVERVLAEDNPNTPLALALAIEANSINNPPALAQSALANASYFGPRWMMDGITGEASAARVEAVRFAGDDQYALYLTDANRVLARVVSRNNPIPDDRWQADTGDSPLRTVSVGRAFVAGGTERGEVYLWDHETGELAGMIDTGREAIWSLAFAPADRAIAVGTESGDILLYDPVNFSLLDEITAHEGRVLTLAFNATGDQIISGGTDTTARLWQPGSIPELLTLRGHLSWVRSVAFSPDDARIVTGSSDGTLIVWDTSNGTIQHHLMNVHNGSIQRAVFSPDGQSFVSVASDTEIILWDSVLGERRHGYSDHRETITGVAFNAEGDYLISVDLEGRFMLWDVEPGPVFRRYEVHSDWAQAAAYSPDSRYAISGSLDGQILLWDLDQDAVQPIDLLYEGEQGILSLAYAPDGTTAAAGLTGGRLLLWDVDGETWRLRDALVEHTDSVRDLVFSPDSRTLLSASDDTSMLLWDVASGRLIRRYDDHRAQVWSAAFSADGRHILSGDEEGILLWWETETATSIVVEGNDSNQIVHEDSIRAVAISPDGQYAVTASDDMRLIRWEINGQPQALDTLDAHRDRVTALAFSPDGRYLLSGSDDQTIIMWETNDWLAIRQLLGHGNVINSVQFSPDARTALSASADRSVIVWRIDSPEELLNWAMVNREVAALTCEDRSIYQVERTCNQDVTPVVTPLATRVIEIAQVATREPALADGTATPTLTALPTITTMPPRDATAEAINFAASEGDNRGELQAGERHEWEFDGTAGQVVTLSVFADSPARSINDTARNPDGLDTVLTVYNPQGKAIATSDDIRNGLITDSQIARFTLPADGTYRLEIRAWDEQASGAYTLRIETIQDGETISVVPTPD